MATVKLENGLLKFKVAPIQSSGEYGEIVECADLSSMTAETAEGETKIASGNRVIYSRKSKGSTTGSLGFYGMPKEVYATLFGSKENTQGAILYGMKDQKPLVALIVEFTAVNPETNLEEDGYIIFPKVSFGELSEDAATKDADGNESINAKTLNFTATALDNANRTYKLKGFGSTPGTITKEMFDPKPSSSSV